MLSRQAGQGGGDVACSVCRSVSTHTLAETLPSMQMMEPLALKSYEHISLSRISFDVDT